jgi:hypothetical protein
MRALARTVALFTCVLGGACFDGEELLNNQPCRSDDDCFRTQVCRDGGLDDFGVALGLRCLEALECTEADCSQNCSAQSQACSTNYDCMNLMSCLSSCGTDQNCIDTCRSSWPNGTAAYDAIGECMTCCASSGDTGGGSATSGPGTSTSTTGMPPTSSTTDGTCVNQGGSCLNGEVCCGGTTCVFYAEGDSRCEQTCTYGGECATCCCVPLQSMSTSVCVDQSYCGYDVSCLGGCAISGSQCGTASDCCQESPYGSVCIQNSGMWNSCFQTCSTGADCYSGCCNYNSFVGQNICETC